VNGEAGDVVAPGRLPHKTWEMEQGEGSHDVAPAVAAAWLGRAIFPKAPTGWLTGIGMLPGGVLGMPVPVRAFGKMARVPMLYTTNRLWE